MLDEDCFEELRLMNIDELKKLAKAVKEEVSDNKTKRLLFFHFALLPYYECLFWDGMSKDAGHIIYRISDFLTKEERCNIEIYPTDGGSIIIDNCAWDSLEDWRKQWEKYHPVIPDFTRKLPSSLLELFAIK